MARILVLNPIGHEMYDQSTLRVACSGVGARTSVAVRHLPTAPATPFIASQEQVVGPLLSAVIEGERDGFDAVVIACCSDPGLRDAKTLVHHSICSTTSGSDTAKAFRTDAVES